MYFYNLNNKIYLIRELKNFNLIEMLLRQLTFVHISDIWNIMKIIVLRYIYDYIEFVSFLNMNISNIIQLK